MPQFIDLPDPSKIRVKPSTMQINVTRSLGQWKWEVSSWVMIQGSGSTFCIFPSCWVLLFPTGHGELVSSFYITLVNALEGMRLREEFMFSQEAIAMLPVPWEAWKKSQWMWRGQGGIYRCSWSGNGRILGRGMIVRKGGESLARDWAAVRD